MAESGNRITDGAVKGDSISTVPSWIVGICGVAAVASALFTLLLFLNR
jgi:hypothetical protein